MKKTGKDLSGWRGFVIEYGALAIVTAIPFAVVLLAIFNRWPIL